VFLMPFYVSLVSAFPGKRSKSSPGSPHTGGEPSPFEGGQIHTILDKRSPVRFHSLQEFNFLMIGSTHHNTVKLLLSTFEGSQGDEFLQQYLSQKTLNKRT